jgi:hypothetical protein
MELMRLDNPYVPKQEKIKLPAVFLSTGHKIEFDIGQKVYLKMDNQQHERMVTGISLRPNRSVTYCLALGTTETWHYGIEIDDERDIVKATTG